MYKAKRKRASKKRHVALSAELGRIKWLMVDGVKHINTCYKFDPNGGQLTVWGYDKLKEMAARRVAEPLSVAREDRL